MIKKGDIFKAYRKGLPTINVVATSDYTKGLLLYCFDSDGQEIYVSKDEIGEILGNIDEL